MKRFNTSIKKLIEAKNNYFLNHGKEAIFLSNWDCNERYINIPNFDYSISREEAQKYYFLTDEINNKEHFQKFYEENFNESLNMDGFTIASNGTSSLMLSLMALKEMQLDNVLITTPIYFSTLNLLDELNYQNITYYNLSSKNDYTIDLQKLECCIKNNRIQILIITNPLFGTGIELDITIVKDIVTLCNKYNIWFVMDYVYGGFPWVTNNDLEYMFNYKLFNTIQKCNNYIFVESISKRIFLNGVKTALLFTTHDLLKRILRISVFTVGSMSATQIKTTREIYDTRNVGVITKQISNSVDKAKRNYDKISAIINNTDIHITNASYGYFSLISIPKKYAFDDISYSIDILNKTGILTTPHSRYLLNDNTYSFRVNLLLDENELITGISKIKTLI